MKTTTKFFAIASLAVASVISTNAQAQTMETMGRETGVRLGIGISGGITEDNSPFKMGAGADLRLQVDMSKELSLTATSGYTRMFGRGELPDYDFIPAKGGVKVFPFKALYGLGEIGAGFGIKDGSKTSLIWSAGIGHAWSNGLDISARYEGYQQDSSSSTYTMATGQYALRIAYGFKL